MARKKKNESETVSTEEIVKKVKTAFLDTVVREWLNTPESEWKGLTPLQMIKKGEGQKILDAIKKAEEETKNERNPKKENKDVNRDGVEDGVEKSVGEKAVFSGD